MVYLSDSYDGCPFILIVLEMKHLRRAVVAASGKPLYVGVFDGTSVKIGICEPVTCVGVGKLPAQPSRIVQ